MSAARGRPFWSAFAMATVLLAVLLSSEVCWCQETRKGRRHVDDSQPSPFQHLPFLCVRSTEHELLRSRDCCPSPHKEVLIIPIQPTVTGPIIFRNNITVSELCRTTRGSLPPTPSRVQVIESRTSECHLDGETTTVHTYSGDDVAMPTTCVYNLAQDCHSSSPRYQIVGDLVPCIANRSRACFKKITIILLPNVIAPSDTSSGNDLTIIELWTEPGNITLLKVAGNVTRHRRGEAKQFYTIPSGHGVLAFLRRRIRVYLDYRNTTISITFPHHITIRQESMTTANGNGRSRPVSDCGLCSASSMDMKAQPLLCYPTCRERSPLSAEMTQAIEFCQRRLSAISPGCLSSLSGENVTLELCQSLICAGLHNGYSPDEYVTEGGEVCAMLMTYGQQCSAANHDVDWTYYSKCGLQCGDDMVVDTCVRDASCSDLSLPRNTRAQQKCRVGCRCVHPDRALLHGRCKLRSRCPCISKDGIEFPLYSIPERNSTHACQCLPNTRLECKRLQPPSLRLSLVDRPHLTHRSVFVEQGRHCVQMQCRVQRAFPWPRLYFRKSIHRGQFYIKETTRSLQLTIPVMSQDFQSIYECHVLGSAQRPGEIALVQTNLPYESLRVQPMEDKHVSLGSNVVLECQVSGNPTPRVKWLRNGEELLFEEPHRVSLHSHCSNRLVIRNVAIDDAGSYGCEATNGFVTKLTEARLLVRVRRRRYASTSSTTPLPFLCVRSDVESNELFRSRDCCPTSGTNIIPIKPTVSGPVMFRSNITAEELCRQTQAAGSTPQTNPPERSTPPTLPRPTPSSEYRRQRHTPPPRERESMAPDTSFMIQRTVINSSQNRGRKIQSECQVRGRNLQKFNGREFRLPSPTSCLYVVAGDCTSANHRDHPTYKLLGRVEPCADNQEVPCFKQFLLLFGIGLFIDVKRVNASTTELHIVDRIHTFNRGGKVEKQQLPDNFGIVLVKKGTVRINLSRIQVNIRIAFPRSLSIKVSSRAMLPTEAATRFRNNTCGLCGWNFDETPSPLKCYAVPCNTTNNPNHTAYCLTVFSSISPSCPSPSKDLLAQCEKVMCRLESVGVDMSRFFSNEGSDLCNIMLSHANKCASTGHGVDLIRIPQCGPKCQPGMHVGLMKNAMCIVDGAREEPLIGCRCTNPSHKLYANECIPADRCPCLNTRSGQMMAYRALIHHKGMPKPFCQCLGNSTLRCDNHIRYNIDVDLVGEDRGNRVELFVPQGQLCVELRCRLSAGFPVPTLVWQKEATPGGGKGVYHVREANDGTTLTIPVMKRNLESRYNCYIGEIPNDKQLPTSIELTMEPVSYPLRVGNLTTPEPKDIGERAQFDCSVSGRLAVNVTWLKNGAKYIPDGTRVYVDNLCSNRLIFSHILREDDGYYSCHVTSGRLSQVVSAYLTVKDHWGIWAEWSPCSTSCGPGNRTRVRQCDTNVDRDLYCPGNVIDVQPCYRSCSGLCNVVGSLWYTTFDHFEYMFQSNCWYVLARHCSNSTQHKPLFTIMQRTGKTVDSPSYKKTIGIEMILTNEQRINVSNSMIRLGKERAQLLVDFPGNRVYGDSMITVKNGTTVSISAYEGTQHYLKVNIDYSLFGDYLRIVDVLVGPEYYNKTCGLCGTWNENSYDDTTVSPWSEWGRMRTQQFVEHYKEPSNQTCDLSFSETCSFNLTLTGEAISLCMMLLNNTQDSPFYECREALNRTGIPGTCVKDACVCLQDRKKSPAWCQCKALQPAKTYCAWNGHSTPVCKNQSCSNRNALLESTDCIPNCCMQKTYTCNRTVEAICSEKEDCECEHGESYHHGRCIPTHDCPCHYGNETRQRGEVEKVDCRICTCEGQDQWHCSDIDCEDSPRLLLGPARSQVLVGAGKVCCGADMPGVQYQWYTTDYNNSARSRIPLLDQTSRWLHLKEADVNPSYYVCKVTKEYERPNDHFYRKSEFSQVLKYYDIFEMFQNRKSSRQRPQTCGGVPEKRIIKLPTDCYLEGQDQGDEQAPLLQQQQRFQQRTGETTVDIGRCSLRPCALRHHIQLLNTNPNVVTDECAYSSGTCCLPSLMAEATAVCHVGSKLVRLNIPVIVECGCGRCYRHRTVIKGQIGATSPERLRFSIGTGNTLRQVPTKNNFLHVDVSKEDSNAVALRLMNEKMPPFSTALPVLPGRVVSHRLSLPPFRNVGNRTFIRFDTSQPGSSSSLTLPAVDSSASVVYSFSDLYRNSNNEVPGSFTYTTNHGGHMFAQPLLILSVRFSGVNQSDGLTLRRMTWKFTLTMAAQYFPMQFMMTGPDGRWGRQSNLTRVIEESLLPTADLTGLHFSGEASLPLQSNSYAIGLVKPMCYAQARVTEAGQRDAPIVGATVIASWDDTWSGSTRAVTDAWGIACVPVLCGRDVTLKAHSSAGSFRTAKACLDGEASCQADKVVVSAARFTEQCVCDTCTDSDKIVAFHLGEQENLDDYQSELNVWEGFAQKHAFHHEQSTATCFMALRVGTSREETASYLLRAVSMGLAPVDGEQQLREPTLTGLTARSSRRNILYGWRQGAISTTPGQSHTGSGWKCLEIAAPVDRPDRRTVRVMLQVERLAGKNAGADDSNSPVQCSRIGNGLQPVLTDNEFRYRRSHRQHTQAAVLRVRIHNTLTRRYGIYCHSNRLFAEDRCLKGNLEDSAIHLQCN